MCSWRDRTLGTAAAVLLTAAMAGVVWTPGPASAQGQDAAAEREARMERIRSAFPADAAERIRRTIREMDRAGLPSGPVVDKALEGAAKGVPPGRVEAAVTAYADRLRQASDLVPGGGRDDLVAASDALRRGTPPDAVRDVARNAGQDRPAALVVLGDLVEAGVPVEQARDVVETALQQGRRGEGLLGLPGAVRRLQRQGTPPGLAARAVARAMAGKGPPAGVPPVQLPPQAVGPSGGPPVPPGAGPPEGKGPPDEKGPPGGGPPGGGGGSGGSGSGGSGG